MMKVDKIKIPRSLLNAPPASQQPVIYDVRHVSSYNWLDTPEPTIAVPGCPPLWNPPGGDQCLEKNTQWASVSRRIARHPGPPLESLFRALYLSKPTYHIGSVDIVSDPDCIQLLLEYADRDMPKSLKSSFCLHLEVVGDTLIMCQDETFGRQSFPSNDKSEYSLGFKMKNTTQRIAGSTGYYRVISYRFAGLKLLLHQRADAYVASELMDLLALEENAPGKNEESYKRYYKSRHSNSRHSNTIDDVTKPEEKPKATNLALSEPSPAYVSPNRVISQSKGLQIQHGGWDVLHFSTVAIFTRSQAIPFVDVAAHLWISQKRYLVRSAHKPREYFVQETLVENVTDRLLDWERQNKAGLTKLAALMHMIVHEVKRLGRATVRYDPVKDVLVIEKRIGPNFLPNDLYARWGET